MPASARSLRVTDAYRQRLAQLRQRATAQARAVWSLDIADLDRSHQAWVAHAQVQVTEMQRAGALLSVAYLTAYMTSETGRPAVAPTVDPDAHAGMTRDGRPLVETLTPTLFAVKAAIGAGHDFGAASRIGLNRAVQLVAEESISPARETLAEAVREDDRIVGWRRVTSGGCLACVAAATGAIQADDELLETHPHCSCSKEPVVADVSETVERPTGPAMFEAMAPAEQDARWGERAALLRDGQVGFADLIHRDPMAVVPDGISEAPLAILQ